MMDDPDDPALRAMIDLQQLANGLLLHSRLQAHMLDQHLEWIVPPGLLDGVTVAYGIPVRHLDGATEPYLAHRIEIRETT